MTKLQVKVRTYISLLSVSFQYVTFSQKIEGESSSKTRKSILLSSCASAISSLTN